MKTHSFKIKDSNEMQTSASGIQEDDLSFLNRNYSFSTSLLSGDAGEKKESGLTRFVRKVFSKIVTPYQEQESRYHESLVRVLNELSRNVSLREARVSDDIDGTLRAFERTLNDTLKRESSELRTRVEELEKSNANHQQSLKTLESVVEGMEGIIHRLSQTSQRDSLLASGSEPSSSEPKKHINYSYLLLENRFRGSEEDIAKRLSFYPNYFLCSSHPVLEIGCGRGELLEHFSSQGIKAIGIELDDAMVEVCVSKGLSVEKEGAVEFLTRMPDASLGGVVAIQVVEHLEDAYRDELFSLCLKKVVPGGKVIFETINTESMVALTQNYFRDPTHVWPMHPDTMRFLLQKAGLSVKEVKPLSPFGPGAELSKISTEEFMTPRWKETCEKLNQNFSKLNALLFGHQDYCIVAEVPKG